MRQVDINADYVFSRASVSIFFIILRSRSSSESAAEIRVTVLVMPSEGNTKLKSNQPYSKENDSSFSVIIKNSSAPA